MNRFKTLLLCLGFVPLAWLCSHTDKTQMAYKTLGAPIAESKFYKLFPGYTSSDDFEGSGVQVVGNYFYAVFDNRYKIGRILNTLPASSNSNTLIGAATMNSNFEGITFHTYPNSGFYTVEESVLNGQSYYPRIDRYDSSLTLKGTNWTDYAFKANQSNKAFEGLAYLNKGGVDYMIGLVEGTGNLPIMKLVKNTWTKIAEMSLPANGVTFSDFADVAILNGRYMAVVSQEDSKMWIGTFDSDTWSLFPGGTIYTFPRGDTTGVIGKGNSILYGNLEGVSFINDQTLVLCSDKIGSGQPQYQNLKAESIHIFKLN